MLQGYNHQIFSFFLAVVSKLWLGGKDMDADGASSKGVIELSADLLFFALLFGYPLIAFIAAMSSGLPRLQLCQ